MSKCNISRNGRHRAKACKARKLQYDVRREPKRMKSEIIEEKYLRDIK